MIKKFFSGGYIFLVLAFIYIVLVLIISLMVKILEKIFAKSDKKISNRKKAKAV